LMGRVQPDATFEGAEGLVVALDRCLFVGHI
jgi:hypothetical protein